MNLKKISLFVLLLSISFGVYSQVTSIKGKSEIKEATVFFDRAQIFRKASVNLVKGKNEIRFSGISTLIEAQSLKVGGEGNFTILSVKYETDIANTLEPSAEEKKLQTERTDILFTQNILKTELAVFTEQEVYLKENKKVTYEGNTLSPESYREYQKIYFEEMGRIRYKRLYLQRSVDSITLRIREIDIEIQKEQAAIKKPNGSIYVSISSKMPMKAKLDMSYMVSNVGWFASYDLRVDDITKPVKLVYKANIFQNTGNDWKNVKLTFSNATPSQNNSLPAISSYTLYKNNQASYNKSTAANRQYKGYNSNIRQVSGYIRDAKTNEAIPFANIYCAQTKVGTTSDLNGYYFLNVPEKSINLSINYIGYSSRLVNISDARMDVRLNENSTALESVMISKSIQKMPGRLPSSRYDNGIQARDKAKTVVASAPVENKTSIEFKVDIPYTIKTDSKAEVITIGEHAISASYEYHIHPRQEQAAFLIARITDWEKYKLISGNANLYLESTFVGKTYLNTKYVKDTIDVSMGKDQSVFVNRERVNSFTKTQVVGSNRIESRAWEIKVRNAKSYAIPIVLMDQAPISTNKYIKVYDVLMDQNMTHDEKTGFIEANFKLEPKATKTLKFSYKVSFTKSYYLHVE